MEGVVRNKYLLLWAEGLDSYSRWEAGTKIEYGDSDSSSQNDNPWREGLTAF
jgi:hypothetical protein